MGFFSCTIDWLFFADWNYVESWLNVLFIEFYLKGFDFTNIGVLGAVMNVLSAIVLTYCDLIYFLPLI